MGILKRALFIIIFLFISFASEAKVAIDGQKTFSELLQIVNEQKFDSLYFVGLNSLSYRYSFEKRMHDSAAFFQELLLDHALKLNRKDLELVALSRKVNIFEHKLIHFEAIKTLEQCYHLAIELKDTAEMTRNLVKLATAYNQHGINDQALIYFDSARNIALKTGDSLRLAAIYNNIAAIFAKDFDKAEYYYKLALAVHEAMRNNARKFPAATNLGTLYSERGDFEKANEMFEIAKNAIPEGSPLWYSQWKIQYSAHLIRLKKETEAEFILTNIINDKNEPKFILAAAATTLSELYFDQGKNSKAEVHASNAFESFRNSGELEEQKICLELLVKLSKRQKKTQQTLKYQEDLLVLRDSINKDINSKQLLQMRLNFDFQTQQQDLALLKTKNELNTIKLETQKYKDTYWFAGTISLMLFSFLLFTKFRDKKKSNKELIHQNQLIKSQKEVIEKERLRTKESLECALDIQKKVLAPEAQLQGLFEDHFLLYEPKDIVSGDFFWHFDSGNADVIAVVDCTGHGVPGALSSMLCYNLLEKVVKEFGVIRPDLILNLLSREMARTNSNNNKGYHLDIGMEVSICAINKSRSKIQFTSSCTPGYILRNNEFIELDRDPLVLGRMDYKKGDSFNMSEIPVKKGDQLYIFTDGFIDQKGGKENKKYYSYRFKELLVKNGDKPMAQQHQALKSEWLNWKGPNIQIDDITVLGIKL
ncbi:MAG: SpoIIE family protein phosphatase [Flavobacteriales bacterium]|nr:SpoIIE family protein phosphatase [Flavobacteriales bacterium]